MARSSTKRRPSLPAKERGGPLHDYDVVTLSSPSKQGNPPAALKIVLTVDDAGQLHLLSQSGAHHSLRDANRDRSRWQRVLGRDNPGGHRWPDPDHWPLHQEHGVRLGSWADAG